MARIPETIVARRQSGPVARGATVAVRDRATDEPVAIYGTEVGGGALPQPVDVGPDGALTFWRETESVVATVSPPGDADYELPLGGALAAGGEPEAWHEVGGAGEPAFQNAWANRPAMQTVAFRLDRGLVQFKGVIEGGDNTVAFTLPVGYRPIADTVLAPGVDSVGGADFGQIRVLANGDVIPNFASAGDWGGLDGCSFAVA